MAPGVPLDVALFLASAFALGSFLGPSGLAVFFGSALAFGSFGSAAAAVPPQPLWRAALALAARLFGAPSRTKRFSSSRGARARAKQRSAQTRERDKNQGGSPAEF